MQISTSQFYASNQRSMQSLTAQANELQTQIATTKKINAPSDDAVAYRRLQNLARAGADDTAYKGNITLASATLSQADTTLSSITDALQRAQEIAIKANSGTLSTTDRSVLADQLDSIVGSLVGFANARDSRGAAIFADGNTAAVTANADGTYTLATGVPATIPIGAGESVQPGASAASLFATPGGGNILHAVKALATALRGTGSLSPIAGSTGDALKASNDQIAGVQASLGARAARVDLESKRLKDVATDREATRSALEDTDVTATIIGLQKMMTVLQATQASFTKLASLSLFDHLR